MNKSAQQLRNLSAVFPAVATRGDQWRQLNALALHASNEASALAAGADSGSDLRGGARRPMVCGNEPSLPERHEVHLAERVTTLLVVEPE